MTFLSNFSTRNSTSYCTFWHSISNLAQFFSSIEMTASCKCDTHHPHQELSQLQRKGCTNPACRPFSSLLFIGLLLCGNQQVWNASINKTWAWCWISRWVIWDFSALIVLINERYRAYILNLCFKYTLIYIFKRLDFTV